MCVNVSFYDSVLVCHASLSTIIESAAKSSRWVKAPRPFIGQWRTGNAATSGILTASQKRQTPRHCSAHIRPLTRNEGGAAAGRVRRHEQ